MNKHVPVAIILITLAVLTLWLWPEEQPAPVVPPPVVQPVKQAPAEEESPPPEAPPEEQERKLQVTFVNHLGDATIQFTVDDKLVCTADPGGSCYGFIPMGKHVAKGVHKGKVVRTIDFELKEDTPSPKVTVCFPTSPDC